MSSKTAGQIQELGGHIEEFAGKETAQKVMAGSEQIAKSSDKEKVAVWVKEAIDCLDNTASAETCHQVMTACGYNCLARASGLANGIKNRRKKHATEEAFLEAEIKKPLKGIRLELQGKTLIHYYTPRTYSSPRRCFCGLMNALPEETNTSLTYCHCARAFVEKYWEGALGRPVKVEVVETCLGGAEECKFIIHLE
jgi:hypothetical protein